MKRGERPARRGRGPEASGATLPLSIVVVAYDIERELPRTLQSLAVGYQQGVEVADYEVIVVDNGSPIPVDASGFSDLPGQFRVIRIDDASPSPAGAVNRGLEAARGATVGVMVDGARLASPGLVRFAIAAARLHPRAAITTLGWYLGFDFQRFQLEAGWTKDDEDRLLESIDWPSDGYRLYEISTMDESNSGGWFFGQFESNALFLPAEAWDELGGFDERFDTPGGGLVNHDALVRASLLDDLEWVMLLGEGTFHQLHGGVATNASADSHETAMARWSADYEAIAGRPVRHPTIAPVFLGVLPVQMRQQYAQELNARLGHEHLFESGPPPPPVPLPDASTVSDPMAAEWARLAGDAARRGLNVETTLYGRRARNVALHTAHVERLVASLANMGTLAQIEPERRIRFNLDAGDACERVGELAAAADHYQAVLVDDPRNAEAYRGLARVRMPGPSWHAVLGRVHDLLDPVTYLELGVGSGDALRLAHPPTVAIAVDPEPDISAPVRVECHLYRETSTAFFEHRDVRTLLGGHGPGLVLLDGPRELGAVLEDFWRVEAISDRGTIVVIPDTIPYDEATQRAPSSSDFHSGDVWKLLPCLATVRPELSWFTVRAAPCGLTFVSGLDPASTVLRDRFAELLEQFGGLPFEESLHPPGAVLENDWELVAARLQAWSVEAPTADGEVGPVIEGSSRDALSRSVRELEERERARRAETEELRWSLAAANAALGERDATADATAAELQALRSTKLYRWTRPVRRVVARVRHHGEVA